MVLSYIESFYAGLWEVIKIWWWFLLPVFLYFPAKHFYLWWIQWETWYKELEWMVLEVVPPAEVVKPYRAMEDVFAAIWPIYDSPNWREQWCEGEFYGAPFWISFEVAGLEGEIHFYIRLLKSHRKMVEAILHTHYPDLELFEAEDYTKNVPQNIPNEEWDMYGEDYVLMKPEEPYPIKTYKFFEISPGEIDPEKKLDVFANVLERMAKLGPGQQFWFQVIPAPITNNEVPWVTAGEKLVHKITERPDKNPKMPSIGGEAYRLLAHKDHVPFGKVAEAAEKTNPELRLTPGERDTVGAIEEKISKLGFKTTIRGIYVYKKENYDPAHKTISRGYFLHFADQTLNGIRFSAKTRPKIHYFFRKRRMYNRKKKMFQRYVARLMPNYPDLYKTTMVLNTEELATIYHYPMTTAGLPPSVPRITAKKGGPPPVLPTE